MADAISIPTGSLGYVVDPALRRRGRCTAMVRAVTALAELAHVGLFTAGVDPANAASAGCLLGAGFRPPLSGPDWEGIVSCAWSRWPRPG